MSYSDFVRLVRTMRRDQREYEEHLTSAANMERKYSEKLVDDALVGLEDEVVEIEVADEPLELKG